MFLLIKWELSLLHLFDDEDHADDDDHNDLDILQIAKAVTDLTAHDLLKQNFPSRPSERMHMVTI